MLFRSVIVAPSMVGLPLGALVGIEVKGPRGRTSEDQDKALLLLSERFAAFAGVARSVDDAARIVAGEVLL